MKKLGALKSELAQNLACAGNPYNLTVDKFLATKLSLCLFVLVLTCVFLGRLSLWCLFLGWIAYSSPSLWLKARVNKRQAEIRRELPYALDLLVLSVEAGLDFIAALGIIVEKSPEGQLRNEFSRLLYEIKMGKRRRDAIGDLGLQIGVGELRQLSASLIQAEELGTDLGMVLRIQSEEVRRKQFARAERQAMEAPVKMLLPLIGFIFPAVFIILLGPIFIQLLQFVK